MSTVRDRLQAALGRPIDPGEAVNDVLLELLARVEQLQAEQDPDEQA